jgi:glycosyltransferase involved in cell wall biosynthesis
MSSPGASLSIVHLLAPAPFGGLETVVVSLTSALALAGHRVVVGLVVTPDGGGRHPVEDALADTGVVVERVELSGRDYYGERRWVRSILERQHADVLHTHGYRPDVLDAPVARRIGIPTVTTVHGYSGHGWKNRVYEWMQTRALRRFDAVIAVSDKLERELVASGVRSDRVHSIRNAWAPRGEIKSRGEAARVLRVPATGRRVGWVGRMSDEKAPAIMVQAAAMVKAEDVNFSMIGEGPERALCESMSGTLGMGDRIQWHGVVREAGTLLKAFDGVVLTSWTEGTPMLLLEAMSAGVPIITTAVGGIPEVVSSSEARLCPAGDVECLAEAIGDLFDRPDSARERAIAAKRRFDADFSLEPWSRRHLEIYRALVGS